MTAELSHFDIDGFVRDRSRPLQCVTAVADVEVDERGVTLRCSTTLISRRMRDRTGTMLETADPIGPGPDATIRIDAVTDHVARCRAVRGRDVPANETAMLDGPLPTGGRAEVAQRDDSIVVETPGLRIEVDRDPYRMRITDATGRTLVETIPAAVYQHPPTGESHIDGRALSDAWPWFFRDLTPLGWMEDDETGEVQVFDTATLQQGEAIFGLGERFMRLDKRGQAVNLWHVNAAGQTWPLSYKNVPFFLSSNGWGHFVNSTRPVTYHLGDLSSTHQSWHVQDGLLDWFCIAGPTPAEVLDRYTELTGRPMLPPRWSYGLWMSRMSYREQTEVEEVATRLREERVPCDVIHIDTDWFAKEWVNDLEFSPERFPDPAGMIATLRQQGLRTTLWQLPYISVDSKLYAEGAEHGYFATKDGAPRHIGGFFGEAGVVDFSNPDASAWYTSKLRPLFDMGIAAIKTDFGEGAPHDADWHAVDGLEMHNLYPLLYNRAVFEASVEATGEQLIWGRSATAGSQRYPVYWGGDPAVRWEDLGQLLAGGLSLGLCGFPFWSQDIGGFAGTPDAELYVRWAQCGLFMTHPRAHGPIAREPWVFGERALEIFRRYAELRYRLLPYVWSEAETLAPIGQPVMRPLLLDHFDDPTTFAVHDQFLFGRSLLLAPIVTADGHRRAYLPDGRWVRWDTGSATEGPRWLEVDAALDELPMWVRGGSIVPLADLVQQSEQVDWSHLTLWVVRDRAGRASGSIAPDAGTAPRALTVEPVGPGRVELRLDPTRSFTVRFLDEVPTATSQGRIEADELVLGEGVGSVVVSLAER